MKSVRPPFDRPGLQREPWDRPSGELLSFMGLAEASARREAICLALAAAEICWVTPVFLALNWSLNPHPPLLLWLAMLILMLGFYFYYRALVAANLTLRIQQSLLVLGLVLSIVLILRFHVYADLALRGLEWLLMPFRSLADVEPVMPNSWATIMILVYLWARAIHLANRSLSADRVGFSFRSGVVILIAFAFFIKVFTRVDVTGFVLPYFFFALLAVGLARIEEVSLLPNSSQVSFSGFWIGSSVAAVAILVSAGAVVVAFFYGGGLSRLLYWLSPVLVVFQFIIIGTGLLLLMAVDWLLAQFSVDLTALGRGLEEMLARLSQMLVPPRPTPPGTDQPQAPRLIFEILLAAIAIAIPLAIVSLVLLFTWRRLQKEERGKEGDESRESLFSAKIVAQSFQAMLQRGMERLGELAGLVSRFGPGSRFLAAVSIRRIYTNLVRLATEAGYPRAKAQTPYEYLQLLFEAFPGNEADVEVITEAYVNAHYGQVPDSREELQFIRECWHRVQVPDSGRRKQKPE